MSLVIKQLLLTTFILLVFIPLAYPFPGKVVKIADGDTVTILTSDYKQIKIRLYGIDAPEKKQAFGNVSKQALSGLIAGKEVEVEDCGIDRYRRVVGIIHHGGININEVMIEQGLAWVYPQYCKKPFCKTWYRLQGQARKEGLGLWKDAHPVAPWKWRKRK